MKWWFFEWTKRVAEARFIGSTQEGYIDSAEGPSREAGSEESYNWKSDAE